MPKKAVRLTSGRISECLHKLHKINNIRLLQKQENILVLAMHV
jgi:hypothetical protein